MLAFTVLCGVGLPWSHTAESSTLVIAGIGAPKATSSYSLAVSLSLEHSSCGAGGQAELDGLLKDLPAGRMALWGEWKVPGTPRQPSFRILQCSVLNHSWDRCAGSHPHDRGLLGRRAALVPLLLFLYLQQNQPKKGRVYWGSQEHGSLW